jgi:hypothetical protein
MPARKKKVLPKKHHRENNKFLLILLIFLGFVLVIVYSSLDLKKDRSYSREEIISLVNSSMVTIPDSSFVVTLIDGKGEFSDDVVSGDISISEPYYSVKSGKSYDSFAVMTYNMGDLEESVAIALFQLKNGKSIYRGSYPMGEGVVAGSISNGQETGDGGYIINVGYLDKIEGEPMTEVPIEQKILSFTVKDHMIVTVGPMEE